VCKKECSGAHKKTWQPKSKRIPSNDNELKSHTRFRVKDNQSVQKDPCTTERLHAHQLASRGVYLYMLAAASLTPHCRIYIKHLSKSRHVVWQFGRPSSHQLVCLHAVLHPPPPPSPSFVRPMTKKIVLQRKPLWQIKGLVYKTGCATVNLLPYTGYSQRSAAVAGRQRRELTSIDHSFVSARDLSLFAYSRLDYAINARPVWHKYKRLPRSPRQWHCLAHVRGPALRASIQHIPFSIGSGCMGDPKSSSAKNGFGIRQSYELWTSGTRSLTVY